MKILDFQIVQIWYNDLYTGHSKEKLTPNAKQVYAIKIGEMFFLLGEEHNSVYMAD